MKKCGMMFGMNLKYIKSLIKLFNGCIKEYKYLRKCNKNLKKK